MLAALQKTKIATVADENEFCRYLDKLKRIVLSGYHGRKDTIHAVVVEIFQSEFYQTSIVCTCIHNVVFHCKTHRKLLFSHS